MSQTYAKIKGYFDIDAMILPDSMDGSELKSYKFTFEPYEMIMLALKEFSDDYWESEYRSRIVNFDDFLDSIHYGDAGEDVKEDFATLVMETVRDYIEKDKLELESVDFYLKPNVGGRLIEYSFEVIVNVDMGELWWSFKDRNWVRIV